MKKRRSNGEGGLSWDKERQKWCGTLRDTNGKPHKFRHVDKATGSIKCALYTAV